MFRISSPVAPPPQAAPGLHLLADAAHAAVPLPPSARATSPRLQTTTRPGEAAGVDRPQRAAIARAAFTTVAAPSVGAPTFDEKLTEWEWAAPKNCLPHERRARREAAHRIRCLREDGADSLDFDDLYMTALPECLAELPTLRRLNAGCNNLQALPDLPPGLTHLYVHGNCLTHLPDLPPALEVLDAHHNRLTRLPVLPPALMRLVVVGNPIARLPHLPATLRMFCVDPGVVATAIRAHEEKIAALEAQLERLAQQPAPLLPAHGAGDGLARLGTELIGAVAAFLPQASTDAAHASASGKCLHGVFQPGIDIARNRQNIRTTREQIATLKRLSATRTN